MVREYTRRCDTVENIHEDIGNPRLRDRDNYKESTTSCPITKTTNNSHFNSYFSFFICPASIV